ncbi:MAG: glycosyltransferase family 4 protein [Bacteroidales bacterium]|nr:glycosyltransferase family 4 protein [Bacteroidales bacterium]
MNILIINHYAGSPEMGMEFRPYYFAREWVKEGHSVSILAADNSHLRKHKVKIEKSFEEELIDGIKYIWVKTPEYHGNGISRVKNIFSFVRQTYFNAKKIAKELCPDVVIASSTYPSDNYVARKIAKICKAKHIYEVHDLWPLSPMELGNMSKYHPFIMLMQHGENYAYRHCNAVVSMLPNTKEHMKQHGLDLSKWHYIPNGIVIDDWNNSEPIPQEYEKLFTDLKNRGVFIVGYTGGHAVSNALETLIDAASLLQDNNKICFVFVGDGVEKSKLIDRAKGLKNIIFLNPVSKKAMPNLLDKMDAVCFGANKSKLYKYGISMNKMMDYMMAEKPVIQYIDTEYDIIQKAEAGFSVEAQNPVMLAECIKKVFNLPAEIKLQFGRNGKAFVLQNHDYSKLSKDFLNILLLR